MLKELCLIISFLTLSSAYAFSQQTSNTYALIIGISQYESNQIASLSYADEDALAFSAYLQSQGGGKIPAENIQLFLNEQATIAAITHAMQWLGKQCKPNDRAYIYFSGHGDVETENDENKGYLLAYNSPPHSYRNNAISVNSINDLANKLTLENQAQTVIITDACRSGKLAGNIINGKQLVNTQLKKVLNKEVRLISSGADELSAEGKYWGGGRGVFSYYLIQGLQGLADANHDQGIQLNELTDYLKRSFNNDKTLIALQHKQTPLTDGNPLITLAVVNSEILSQLKESETGQEKRISNISTRLMSFKKATPNPIDLFMQIIEKLPIESIINFDSLLLTNSKTFPSALVQAYENAYDSIMEVKSPMMNMLYQDKIINLYHEIDFDKLKKDLNNQPKLFEQFNRRFIEIVHQKGQAMVNAYLNGDLAELEKRQYYYSGVRSYQDYLTLVKTAKAIMPPNDPLDFLIQLHEHYVKGLVIRLQMLTSKQYKKLLPRAFQHLYNALIIDPFAAPAFNELGNLHLQLSNYDSAHYYYKQANQVAPAWAIPWSNTIRLGLASNNLQLAQEAAKMTDLLQPDISYVNINKGLLYEKMNMLLEAEAAYLQAIQRNAVHYLPYERLANLYLDYGDLKKADQYFFESESRKNEFAVNDQSFVFGVELGGFPPTDANSSKTGCLSFHIAKNNELLPYYQLVSTLTAFLDSTNNQEKSLDKLLTVLQLDGGLPLVHHYLGKYYATHGTWQQATTLLQKAIEIKKTSLEKDVLQDSCLLMMLRYYDYDELEDYYLLADLYEKNNFIADAIKLYEIIAITENNRQLDQATFFGLEEEISFIKTYAFFYWDRIINKAETPMPVTGNIKASRLLVKMEKYEMAEAILLKQVELSRQAGYKRKDIIEKGSLPGLWPLYRKEASNDYWLTINYNIETEVFNFYKQVTSILPRYPEWHEKAGSFLYQRLKLAYDKLQPYQYKDFLKVYEENDYPWIVSEGGGFYYPTQFNIPGTNDTLNIVVERYHPLKEALSYLEQYEKLMLSNELKPEIIKALAELNSWLGNKQKAIHYYKQAIQKIPSDKSLIHAYINYLKSIGELPEAFLWMSVLDSTNNLFPAQYPEFIEFHTKSKSFTHAAKYIGLLGNDPTTDSITWLQMNVFKNTMDKKYTTALNDLITLQTLVANGVLEGGEASTQSAAAWYYAEARIYAIQKNNKQALSTLKKSFDLGFNYDYLLQKDPIWKTLRNSNKWQNLIGNYTFSREYYMGGMYNNFIPISNIIVPN